jgi:hypothetical protein
VCVPVFLKDWADTSVGPYVLIIIVGAHRVCARVWIVNRADTLIQVHAHWIVAWWLHAKTPRKRVPDKPAQIWIVLFGIPISIPRLERRLGRTVG